MMALDAWTASLLISKVLLYLGATCAAGTVLFRLSIMGIENRAAVGASYSALWIGVVLTAFFGSAAIGLQAGLLADDGLRGLWNVEMIKIVMEGAAGDSFWLRSGGTLAIAVSTVLPLRASVGVGALGAVFVALSFGLVGHALTGNGLFLPLLVGLHFLGVSHWFGSLWPIYQSARHDGLGDAAKVADRFGQTALWTVATLILAGVVMTVVLVQTLENLVRTPYGQLLAAKIAIVLAIGALGALNKLRLVPRMELGDESARNVLCRSIAWEAALMVTVFVATAALTSLMALPEQAASSSSGAF
ncbi:MAG: CopD family protein [Pseudomonadota bacterium]